MNTAHPKTPARVELTGTALAELHAMTDRRENQRCARCGRIIWSGGSRHHRKLRSQGGNDEAANLILMCGSGTTGCHGWAHANPLAAREHGFVVSGAADPAAVPIEHALYGRCWLDNAGRVLGIPPLEALADVWATPTQRARARLVAKGA